MIGAPSAGREKRPQKPKAEKKGLAARLFPRADYPPYRSSLKQDLAFAGTGILLGLGAGLLFYRSLTGILLVAPGCAYTLLRLGRRKLLRRRQDALRRQFRDYLVSVLSFLRAGYALENAMSGAEKEMVIMHGEEGMISREAARMSNQLKLSRSPEQLLNELGLRTEMPEALQFAKVIRVAKRQGGDYLPVIKSMIRMMDESFALEREIHTLLAGKRLEYFVMCLVPAGMLIYLNLSVPDMSAFLYRDNGALLMSGFLLVYAAAVLLGDRMLEKSYET